MKTLIIANWKMNPATFKEAKQLFGAVKRATAQSNAQVVICPPFVYLPLLKNATLGAQNVFYEEKGAFTGEISPQMLKNLGVEYVIIGHSERRADFYETDEIINKKIKKALFDKLKVIFCVGENAEEDKADILERQITEGLKGISSLKSQISNLVIAYEPVWAIGTGNSCSVNETMSSAMLIKKIVFRLSNKETAARIRILYGGSVDGKNASAYLKEGGVNGLLVGGASLDAKEFIKIVKSA